MLSLDEQIAQFTRLRDAAAGARRAELERGLNLLLDDRRERDARLAFYEEDERVRLAQPMSDQERVCLVKRIAYWTPAGVLKVNKVSQFKTPDADMLASLKRDAMIYWYESPAQTWEMLCGRAGFAIVREDRIVAFHMKLMN